MRRPRRRTVALAAIAAASFVAGCRGCSRTSDIAPEPDPSAASSSALAIPRAIGPLVGDGDLDEPAWKNPARTGGFVGDDGKEARPYSEARLLWDDDHLYLALYAADEDLRRPKSGHDGPLWIGDAFTVKIGTEGGARYDIAFAVDGTISDAKTTPGGMPDATWESGAKAAVERDGTLDDPHDDDEEWLVEAAIPWRSLGVEPRAGIGFSLEISRCDVPKRTPRTCAKWRGEARLAKGGRGGGRQPPLAGR